MKKLFLLILVVMMNCTSPEEKSTQYCTLPSSYFEKGNFLAHKVYQAPVIDGNAYENSWEFVLWAALNDQVVTDSNNRSIAGRYKILWDKEYLYFLIEVEKDSAKRKPLQNKTLTIDLQKINKNQSLEGSNNNLSYTFNLQDESIIYERNGKPVTISGVNIKRTSKGTSYTLEASIKMMAEEKIPDCWNENMEGDKHYLAIALEDEVQSVNVKTLEGNLGKTATGEPLPVFSSNNQSGVLTLVR